MRGKKEREREKKAGREGKDEGREEKNVWRRCFALIKQSNTKIESHLH